MYRDGRYSDIPLKIRSRRTAFSASCCSGSVKPYFEALFRKNWNNGEKKKYMTDIWFIWFGRSIHKISNLKDLLFY